MQLLWRKLYKRLCFYLLGFFFLFSCSAPKKEQVNIIQLPQLESTVVLTVAQVINPRFPSLNKQQIQGVLKKSQIIIKQQFGVDVTFQFKKILSIDAFFGKLSNKVISAKSNDIINFRDGINQLEFFQIVNSIEKSLIRNSEDINSVYYFVKPYVDSENLKPNYRSISIALANTLIKRFETWQKLTSKDTKAIIKNDFYNEWVWWDNIAYNNMPYDIVITNQLVASIETYGMDAHSALRGGISNGTTTFSALAKYQSYSFVSTFPILNNYPIIKLLRSQNTVSDEQKQLYTGAVIAHEVGHLLFHYGHPYNKKECIMSPMPLINFKQWLADLDADLCFKQKHPAMQKGNVKFVYDPKLIGEENEVSTKIRG